MYNIHLLVIQQIVLRKLWPMEVDSIAILGNHEISHREISGESWKKAMGKPVSFTPALIRAIAAYQCLSFLLNHCQSARYSAKKKLCW